MTALESLSTLQALALLVVGERDQVTLDWAAGAQVAMIFRGLERDGLLRRVSPARISREIGWFSHVDDAGPDYYVLTDAGAAVALEALERYRRPRDGA